METPFSPSRLSISMAIFIITTSQYMPCQFMKFVRSKEVKLVVAISRAWNSKSNVGSVSGDLVRDATLFDVVFLGQSKMLFRRHVAQHAGTVVRG